MMNNRRLHDVLEQTSQTAARGELPVVVFDLDSTLFSTRPRNLRILREFAAANSGDRQLVDVVDRLGPGDFGWEVTEPLKRNGLDDEQLFNELREFWFRRFFTDEYVVADTPHPGSVQFCNAVHDAGGFVYYLTGRHVGGMEIGTSKSLTEHGFPFWRGRTSLHLKPSFDIPDKPYKKTALADIRSLGGRVVATFENEPGNANQFRKAFPDALHFLLLTEHSPEAEVPHPELVSLFDFTLP